MGEVANRNNKYYLRSLLCTGNCFRVFVCLLLLLLLLFSHIQPQIYLFLDVLLVTLQFVFIEQYVIQTVAVEPLALWGAFAATLVNQLSHFV